VRRQNNFTEAEFILPSLGVIKERCRGHYNFIEAEFILPSLGAIKKTLQRTLQFQRGRIHSALEDDVIHVRERK
jgi:hypothetical protein